MSEPLRLVLDTNILLGAVLGVRVRGLLLKYEDAAEFYAPEECFEDAQEHTARLAAARGLDVNLGLAILGEIARIVEKVDRTAHRRYEAAARERTDYRDPDDGRSSPPPYCWPARYGPRIRISSAPASRPGTPATSNSACKETERP